MKTKKINMREEMVQCDKDMLQESNNNILEHCEIFTSQSAVGTACEEAIVVSRVIILTNVLQNSYSVKCLNSLIISTSTLRFCTLLIFVSVIETLMSDRCYYYQ